MREHLPTLIFLAGIGQLGVLIASALVPIHLDWRKSFAPLPKLHQQLYWTYGGYIVLAITALGLISLTCSEELASGTPLARALATYITLFWGIRLALQTVFDVKPHLTRWWLVVGYHTLTVMFLFFVGVFGWTAIAP